MQDPRGNRYRYGWNNRGQLTYQTDCSGHSTYLYSDEQGRLSTVTDAQGNSTRQSFSAAGRLEKQIRHDGGETTYRYNARGQLAGMSDPARLEEIADLIGSREVYRHVQPGVACADNAAGV
ncbi:MAG: hypothetical protein ACRCZ6_10580 [Kluyvera sp.]|uniref:hypothetical protein n=1 Tax=Kluyvera sp. TaxID=1538228 RepID=UPI003F31E7EB